MHCADYAVQDVRPSVRPSVRLSACHTTHAGILSKRLDISAGSHTILVFHTKWYSNTPTGTPLTGASNARGIKNREFRPISRFISEMIQDITIITMECE